MANVRAYIGEFLVTLLFFYTVFTAKNEGHEAALLVFLASFGFIQAFGGISGAHFNPAVTFGAVVGGKMGLVDGVIYMVLQIVATLLAKGFVSKSMPTMVSFEPIKTDGFMKFVSGMFSSVVLEFITTFILVFVVYAVAMGVNAEDKNLDGDNSEVEEKKAKMRFAGLAIAATLGFLCFYPKAAFNPAGAFANGIWEGTLYWPGQWVGEFGGATTAALLYKFVFAE